MGEEYEDYIIDKPEGFRLVTKEKLYKAKEHIRLISQA